MSDDEKEQYIFDWLKRIEELLKRIVNTLLGKNITDLDILVEPNQPTKEGSNTMNNKKATGSPIKCQCLRPAGLKSAVMPDITLTTPPSSITLQPVDANGNPVGLSPTDTAKGTLTSDSASFVIGAGADTLHYVATIPANTPLGTVANLSATLFGTIQGAPANLTASVKVTLNIPPTPVAVDLDIIIA